MKSVVSCLQCAMLHACHDAGAPGREAARAMANSCHNPGKGRTTDVVRVIGRERGMSRKNAVKMLLDGKLRWLDPTTVSWS